MLKKGDLFKIRTRIGFGFIQFIETTGLGTQYVRVLEFISETGEINKENVIKKEKLCVEFPLKAAIKRKIVEEVGNYELPSDFNSPEFARSEYIIRGEFLGWHIVNRETFQRILKKELTEEELKLSPFGVVNDTWIIERIENHWKLEDWNSENLYK